MTKPRTTRADRRGKIVSTVRRQSAALGAPPGPRDDAPPSLVHAPTGYAEWLVGLKAQIRSPSSVRRSPSTASWCSCTGASAVTFSSARRKTDGAARSSNVSRTIFTPSFPRCAASHPAISSTCGPSPTHGRIPNLCSRLLHNCPGSTSAPCSVCPPRCKQADRCVRAPARARAAGAARDEPAEHRADRARAGGAPTHAADGHVGAAEEDAREAQDMMIAASPSRR